MSILRQFHLPFEDQCHIDKRSSVDAQRWDWPSTDEDSETDQRFDECVWLEAVEYLSPIISNQAKTLSLYPYWYTLDKDRNIHHWLAQFYIDLLHSSEADQ